MLLSMIFRQVYLQSNFDKKFAITTGLKYKIYKESSETFETDNNDFEFVDNKYLIPYANITLDALDDSMFPTKGLYFDFGAQWYAFADHTNQSFIPFSQFSFKLRWAQNILRKWWLN